MEYGKNGGNFTAEFAEDTETDGRFAREFKMASQGRGTGVRGRMNKSKRVHAKQARTVPSAARYANNLRTLRKKGWETNVS